MVGYTDIAANASLDSLVTTYPYLALFTAVGADNGTGFTEAAFPGYARVTTAGLWAAAVGSSPSSKANNATISFPTATNVGTDCIALGLYTALTGGNLGFYGYLGSFDWKPTSFTLASPAIMTQPNHGYTSGDRLAGTIEYGSQGTIPSGMTTGLMTVAAATTDTFNVGVNTTTTGSLLMRKVIPQSIVNGLVVRFLSGQLILKL